MTYSMHSVHCTIVFDRLNSVHVTGSAMIAFHWENQQKLLPMQSYLELLSTYNAFSLVKKKQNKNWYNVSHVHIIFNHNSTYEPNDVVTGEVCYLTFSKFYI